ncbi:Mitochondrial transcription termination factor family protein [Quillaja saponaria]|uniref:Mitochondrial transcription termination factor family protein n=1 Tax=Quillaja saponaria TaxID=32244 RepID=A0AAD7PYF3_QUISA|nr:Mitochondrial transcription termination factor family protein [Quillaja saponaria]
MTHFRKFRLSAIFKWALSNSAENQLRSSKIPLWPTGSFSIAQNPRYYRTKKTVQTGESKIFSPTWTAKKENVTRISRSTLKEAQAALLEYLHSTRSLQFLDADHMSRNSPYFLEELLKKVEIEENIKHSISRFLRYHPINEFEPFFESMGLKPSEYVPLLPRDLMFLSDDKLLLENYHILFNYGIARKNIGKIYKQATEVFQYDHGVLSSKLRAYEELGLSQPTVVKIIASSPYLLVGDVNLEFVKVIDKLKRFGKDIRWVEGHLLENSYYNWSLMLELLCLFSKIGYSEEQLAKLISQHPDLLFESSGNSTLSLVGFLLKFGVSISQIYSILLQFPQIQVKKFLLNLRRCFLILGEIEMETIETGRIFRSQPLLLGSCTLKKTNSLLNNLNVGKKRLCSLIQENPQVMKNWVLGNRVKPLTDSGEDLESQIQKTKFLLNLGFVENSKRMEEALRVFRGRGSELQERFNCLIQAGLDWKDVSEMIKVSPQILNQTKDVIQMKIDFLVNELEYPISSLVTFPSYLNYTPQRVKLRLLVYNWLKDQAVVEPNLALSTIIACSDNYFLEIYLNRHPNGPEVWQDLKKKIYSKG